MADTDVLIKDLPLTETVNDSDDLVTEDSSPTTHRIKASVVKKYINSEQNEELDGLKVELDNVNSNIGSLSSKVDDATTTVSSMQTNLNSMDGRVQANADNISTLNSALADIPTIQYGSVSAVDCEAGQFTEIPVIFPNAFSSAPCVLISIVSTSTGIGVGNVAAFVANITTTGFTIRVANNDTVTRSPAYRWIAVLR